MLQLNDKIKYVKANSLIGVPLGTIFTVTEIEGTAVAVKTNIEIDGVMCVVQCVMSYDAFEKYFEKVIESTTTKNKTRVWTEWRKIERDELDKIISNFKDYCYIIKYLKDYFSKYYSAVVETRNNGKKTEVRITFDAAGQKVKATTTCNKVDTFNESKGIEVALIKAFTKRIAYLSTLYINTRY